MEILIAFIGFLSGLSLGAVLSWIDYSCHSEAGYYWLATLVLSLCFLGFIVSSSMV